MDFLSTGRSGTQSALVAFAIFVLALFGCGDGGYTLAVTFPSGPIKDRVTHLQVRLLLSCRSTTAVQDKDITLVKGDPNPPSIGAIDPGRYSIEVTGSEVVDGEICALARKCEEKTLEAGGKKTILISLVALPEPICRPVDAGEPVADAGVDAGEDAGHTEPDASTCVPSTEVCNNRDDDCDSKSDETFDKDADRTNCGLCGTVCDEGLTCGAGRCVAPIVEVAPGGRFTCARRANGEVFCWGDNPYGQLGNGTTSERLVPAAVMNLRDAEQISSGKYHMCARRPEGVMVCWGDNTWGELGVVGGALQSSPVVVEDVPPVSSIGLGFYHSCAISEEGQVYCWGLNSNGQVGQPYSSDSDVQRTPTVVPNVQNAVQVDGGWHITCVRHTNGRVSCWGQNDYGQLGDGTTTDRVTAGLVKASAGVPLEDISSISVSADHICALQQSDPEAPATVLCWGANYAGAVGNGTYDSTIRFPTAPGIGNALEISTGVFYSCARRNTGAISCWGANDTGQLGNGSMAMSNVPVDVFGVTSATALHVDNGDFHTCAIREDFAVMCWGKNEFGQLGIGVRSTTPQLIPVRVERI